MAKYFGQRSSSRRAERLRENREARSKMFDRLKREKELNKGVHAASLISEKKGRDRLQDPRVQAHILAKSQGKTLLEYEKEQAAIKSVEEGHSAPPGYTALDKPQVPKPLDSKRVRMDDLMVRRDSALQSGDSSAADLYDKQMHDIAVGSNTLFLIASFIHLLNCLNGSGLELFISSMSFLYLNLT